MNEQKMKRIVIDDMFLTTGRATVASSKMLEGYQSLIDAEVLLRAKAAGYVLYGIAPAGEFGIDLLGETAAGGAYIQNGTLKNLSAQTLLWNDATAALCFDVNGYPRRAAAQTGLVCLKPTHGAISREGIVSVAPSAETVDVLARDVQECRKLFCAVAEEKKEKCAPIRRVAVLTSLHDDVNKEAKQKIDTAVERLKNGEISITYIENSIISASKAVWNVILCAGLCKSTARYDGVRYGHRAEKFSTLEELYTTSRTEGFGDLIKAAILYGSEVLSSENYQKIYEKALRVRRVIANEFANIFGDFDAILLPACSSMVYAAEQVKADKYVAFEENRFTAPASLTGLPAVVAGYVQLIGKANSEHALLDIAKILAGEAE